MRAASVHVQNRAAGILRENSGPNSGPVYVFAYLEGYKGPPVSLTMPVTTREHGFEKFPPFFEGLLPEGPQLESLLRREKIDRDDYFAQLVAIGGDLVGDVTVSMLEESDE